MTFRYTMSKMRAVLQKTRKATDGELSLGCREAYFTVDAIAELLDIVGRGRKLLLYMDGQRLKNR